MITDSALRDFANSNLLRRVSYLASLLVVWYCRRAAYLNLYPSGDLNVTLIPLAINVDEPSTLMTYFRTSSTSSSSLRFGLNFAIKSVNTYALIAFLGWYLTSNSLSSMAHWISHLVAFNLFIAFFNG